MHPSIAPRASKQTALSFQLRRRRRRRVQMEIDKIKSHLAT